jgi:two-component system chemotaxis response regulator CheY
MFDPNTKILVVDDMMTMRKLVSKALKEIGFSHIVEANDGAAGWQTLSENGANFGLVISDWNMPNCTGIDFLKRVRADSRFKNIPFFLVTAESEASQVTQALAVGVSGYIIKPFNTDGLKQKLEAASAKAS